MRALAREAIKRPVGTLALASVVLVLGLFFYDRLAVNLLPEVIYPTIRVTVNYPGVAPEVMEEQVTRVLERQLAGAENLTRIHSRASEGRTNVNLEFSFDTNLDFALQDASRLLELARTQLPPDIDPPRLYKYDPSQSPVFEAGFSSTMRTPREVRDWVEHRLSPQLLALHGVAGVEAAGGLIRELEVVVDQDRLRSYGLSLRDVADALGRENINIVAVVDSVHATLQRLRASGFIPDDIEWRATRDSAFFVRGSLRAVSTAAILGGALAMLVVLGFLGSLRKSLVIGLSIPLAVMATFALMGASGLTLNIMSLGGLALGVGLLLDNAIVMLENISRHKEKLGKDEITAANDGAEEVVTAITAGTLTNLAAVVPFLLITGVAALVFRELILTISFAIIASLGMALTLVPMLAAQFNRLKFESGIQGSAPYRAFDAGLERLIARYRVLLGHALRWRWAVLAAAFALFIGALIQLQHLGTEFLPPVDDGQVSVRMSLPPGTPPERNDLAARMIEAEIRGMPHIDSVFAMVGGHLSGGVISERPGTANISVRLVPAAVRPDWPAGLWVAELQHRLDALDIAGARISVRPPRIQGLNFGVSGSDLSIGIMGEDLAELQRIGRGLVGELEGITGLEGVEIGPEDRTPLLRIAIDRERAAALGLTPGDIGRALRDGVSGVVPTRYQTSWAEYDIRVRLPRSAASDPDTLSAMVVAQRVGDPVLLRDVAHFELGDSPAHIERENQGRILRVNGDFNPALADVGTIMTQVEARLRGFELPDDTSFVLGGQWETIQETNRELFIVMLLAAFLVFVVLAVQYERLSNPLVIMSAAPLSLAGVVGLLWLTGTPVSAPVWLGMILLIGIVVNNAILLVEYIEKARRDGRDIEDAVIDAGGIRLRPILMTTLTTVAGMTPLAIGMGAGADIMQPLALAVVGGLLSAMLLTLFVVPSLYVVTHRAVNALQRALLRNVPATAR